MTAAPENTSFRWFEKSPELGAPADFEALGQLFNHAGYTEEAILERTKTSNIENYCTPPKEGRTIQDSLDALIGLFFDCAFVEESKLAEVLPPGSLPLLDRLGLLAHDHAPHGMVYSTAAIVPSYGFLTACDRGAAPDGSRIPYPADVVYPSILQGSRAFVDQLPATPCDAMLDLGTGSGIAALLGARKARQVWATDITGRAVHFTEFNRRLAGIEHLTAARGDLFEAVEGLTFDRITMHPPFVPAKVRNTDLVFAVSGDDGEQVLRRAVQELPKFLRPGGRFYSLQVATDREGEDFEDRVRKWLGDGHGEFDVMVTIHSRTTPNEYLASDERRLVEESRLWLDLWELTRTTFMLYTTLLIERHEAPRRAITRRGHKGAGYAQRHLEETLDWLKALDRPDHIDMLLACRPRARPENQVTVKYRLRDGKLCPEEYRLEIAGPFALSLRCENWLTQLLPYCDGANTWRELYESAKRDNIIRGDVPIEEFAKGLGVLVSLGAFQLPE